MLGGPLILSNQDFKQDRPSDDTIVYNVQRCDNGNLGFTLRENHEQVNGQDLSKANHEDAVEAFQTAKEPIIVEVLRRSSSNFKPNMATESTVMPSPSPIYCDSSTQTEWSGGWETSSIGFFPFGQTSLMQSGGHYQMSFLEDDVMDGQFDPSAGDPDQDDEDMRCDVEYEEVTLHRSGSQEKLGLTLCYESTEEVETDIFISEIDADSIAGRDGRIQAGDQILQINGNDVHNRAQAIFLFSESRPDFTLLVARPQLQMEDCLLDDHAEDYPLAICSNQNVLLAVNEDDEGTDTGTGENGFNQHEKDSGVGRTDESTRNDESSEHEVAENEYAGSTGSMGTTRPLGVKREIDMSKNSVNSNEQDDMDGEITPEDCEKFREELELKCASTSTTSLVDIHQNEDFLRIQSDSSLDREMALLNQEMKSIQLECESLVTRHSKEQKVRFSNEQIYSNLEDPKLLPESRNRPTVGKKESVERWVKTTSQNQKLRVTSWGSSGDSSSAYNTGESSRSTHLTLELNPMPLAYRQNSHHGSVMSLIAPKMEDKSTQLQESDVASIFSCDSCRQCCRTVLQSDRESLQKCDSPKPPSTLSRSGNRRMVSKVTPSGQRPLPKHIEHIEKNQNYVTFYPSTTMYTNEQNLQHTILLQQQLFRQALAQKQQKKKDILDPRCPLGSKPQASMSTNSYLSSLCKNMTLSTVKEDEEVKMEWKVKRRADGTRYITRRPVRNKLLKERAMKINEERCGVTTDDDAMSELKIGRYWSKEDRKRHLERARDRKRREMMMRAKMGSVKEQAEEKEGGQQLNETKKEINIIELSQKKQTRKKSKAGVDNFTTVQEVLAHGSKGQTGGVKPFGLFSVTTV
ncbi:E3 ubiquitin-protein ligase PDZRN3-like isoform X2 [Limulus polyphemus]|uniref:E3 ubiquitin-protein ligase PDZRN3-like isoform X2 n=1 Tax=Limulus polyphemus TaxID=6850 RepID=A0ABM1S9P7_LIMPO|nr:E3 ubiquitin-protein ligase PDZRN3-like isoform X2 [Limulus polyphemus]